MSALLLLKFEQDKETNFMSLGNVFVDFGEQTTEAEKYYAKNWQTYISDAWENFVKSRLEEQAKQAVDANENSKTE